MRALKAEKVLHFVRIGRFVVAPEDLISLLDVFGQHWPHVGALALLIIQFHPQPSKQHLASAHPEKKCNA